MEARGWNAARNLVFVIGLASVLTAVLLWWVGTSAPATQASTRSRDGQLGKAAITAHRKDIRTLWESTEPVTIEVLESSPLWPITWPITRNGVTITFDMDSLDGDAIFTFTPKEDTSSVPPYLPAPYFFDLSGVWKATGSGVSLQRRGIDIELEYSEPDLGDIIESSLTALHFRGGKWMPEEASIDTTSNLVYWSTARLGSFGIGGFNTQALLPLVLR